MYLLGRALEDEAKTASKKRAKTWTKAKRAKAAKGAKASKYLK